MADQGVETSSINPAYVLAAARAFLVVTQEASETEGGSQEEDGWEQSGCLLWDIASIPEQAELLSANHIQDILQTVIAASVAQERWRALEIALGTLANLACHKPLRQELLASAALAELVMERALWVDDSPALWEACRLLSGLCLGAKGDERWWQLMVSPEGLGRIVWIVENTLSPVLLERALSLLCAMLQAAGEQLPALNSSLLELDILAAADAVLASYLRRLEKEEEEFAGPGEGGGQGKGPGTGDSRAQTEGEGQAVGGSSADADGAAGTEGEAEAAAAPDVATAVGAALTEAAAAEAAAAAVGPEVSEAIVVEALSLLDTLTATPAGAAALSQSGPLVESVVQLLAVSESRPVTLVCVSLLGSLEGVGELLLARPEAVRGALGVLAEAQRNTAGAAGATEPAEVGAAWALCSAALHTAAMREGAAAGVAAPAAEGPVPAGGAGEESGAEGGDLLENDAGIGAVVASSRQQTALVAAAVDARDVLLGDWSGGEAVTQQQYCLRQLQLLLGRLGARDELPEGAEAFEAQVEARLGEADGSG